MLGAGAQRLDECPVLGLVERAIDVVGAGAGRAGLVVAGLQPGHLEVDAVAMHDRRDRIEERERVLAGDAPDRLRELGRGQRAGRDDHVAGGRIGQRRHRLAADLDQHLGLQRVLHVRGETVPIDRERAARRQLVRIARAHDKRVAAPHLLVQQPDRVVQAVVGAERVGADQLGERAGLVRGGRPARAHLVEDHRNTGLRQLPGRLAAGEPATDHVDRLGHRVTSASPSYISQLRTPSLYNALSSNQNPEVSHR